MNVEPLDAAIKENEASMLKSNADVKSEIDQKSNVCTNSKMDQKSNEDMNDGIDRTSNFNKLVQYGMFFF